MASCNEKVAEELRESGPGSSGGGGVISPTIQSMSVVSKMDSDLSFVMHKAGSIDEACILKPPASGFKAEDYTKTDGIRNVDCILDVEELDLYFQGAQYEIQVENKMCEYVEYQPYRFFGMQPGTTTRGVYRVTCDSACSGAKENVCGKVYTDTDGLGTYSPASFVNNVTAEFDKGELCRFNYSTVDPGVEGEYPNCDNGSVKTTAYKLEGYYIGCEGAAGTDQPTCEANGGIWRDQTYCEGAGEPAGTVTVIRDAEADEDIECGGSLKACLACAGVDQIDDRKASTIIESDVTQFRKEYVIDPPIQSEMSNNMHIASFSRICSDTSTNKFSPSVFETLTYNGAENERIATGFNSISIDINSDTINDYTIRAVHPFAGQIYSGSDGASRSTSAYYAIRCLDRAGDVKAQIRMHIREWDREFSSNDLYLSRVSDKANEAGNLSKMDNNNFYDTDVPWNDYIDWDDFFEAEGVFVDNMCAITQGSYGDGLNNNPMVDPNEGLDNFPGILNK